MKGEHEIRDAQEYANIFNTVAPAANQVHEPRANTRRVVMFDGSDRGRMFAVLHDGRRYESAPRLHAADDIGMRKLLKLGDGWCEVMALPRRTSTMLITRLQRVRSVRVSKCLRSLLRCYTPFLRWRH